MGGPQELADSLLAAARTVVAHVDMRAHEGAHPCIGALDVVPIAYLREEDRELAHDEALAVANRLAAELDLPVFVYGELASADHRRERAFFREGGVSGAGRAHGVGRAGAGLRARRACTRPPGAALVAARPPLVAFNVELDTDDVDVREADRGQGARGAAAGCRACARSA